MRHRSSLIDGEGARATPESSVVVHDQPQPCPYLPEQEARMPLIWPVHRLNPTQLDRALDAGYRRSGSFLYHTQCPRCQACEPVRLDVQAFQPTRSMRRVLNRCDPAIRISVGQPAVDPERLRLVNRHREQRALAPAAAPLDAEDYAGFLVDTCCTTREIAFRREGRLVAVAICDFGETSLSAVYCYFDPAEDRWSLGTYAILKQIELARSSGRRYLYLGMFVQRNRHLRYKARFVPQQRRIGGRWQPFATQATTD